MALWKSLPLQRPVQPFNFRGHTLSNNVKFALYPTHSSFRNLIGQFEEFSFTVTIRFAHVRRLPPTLFVEYAYANFAYE